MSVVALAGGALAEGGFFGSWGAVAAPWSLADPVGGC